MSSVALPSLRTRSFAGLTLAPIAIAVFFAIALLIPEPLRTAFFQWGPVVVNLAAAIGCGRAMRCFAPADALFKTWLFSTIAYSINTIGYVTRVIGIPHAIQMTFTVAINVAMVLAFWLFVRAWKQTGIASPLSAGQQATWTFVGIVVALVVGGYPLIEGFAASDLYLIVSSLGDVIGLAFIVPLALPALALRGGILMYVWVYLTLSQLFWMLFDIVMAAGPVLGVDPHLTNLARQVPRTAAVLYVLSAATAQRRALE